VFLTRSVWVSAAVPLLVLAQVYVFGFVVRFSTGGFDTSELPLILAVWDRFLTWTIKALMYLIPVAALAALVSAITRHTTVRNAAAVFALCGVGVVHLAWLYAPGIVIGWFFGD
jgi:hypothetical protein